MRGRCGSTTPMGGRSSPPGGRRCALSTHSPPSRTSGGALAPPPGVARIRIRGALGAAARVWGGRSLGGRGPCRPEPFPDLTPLARAREQPVQQHRAPQPSPARCRLPSVQGGHRAKVGGCQVRAGWEVERAGAQEQQQGHARPDVAAHGTSRPLRGSRPRKSRVLSPPPWTTPGPSSARGWTRELRLSWKVAPAICCPICPPMLAAGTGRAPRLRVPPFPTRRVGVGVMEPLGILLAAPTDGSEGPWVSPLPRLHG
mmetsp:Transcript_24238/g.76255  ORF Transcript_24238/g.76255 Transcript_24238/m.76255 type:complete len:257 (+) Transcript_24238:168-938(+)